MATVAELSDPYAAFMRNPLAPDSDQIFEVCLRFTDGRFPTCYQCGHRDRHTDAVLPISYHCGGWRIGAADRRHLGIRRLRPERGRGAQGSGRRRGGSGGLRASHRPGLR